MNKLLKILVHYLNCCAQNRNICEMREEIEEALKAFKEEILAELKSKT